MGSKLGTRTIFSLLLIVIIVFSVVLIMPRPTPALLPTKSSVLVITNTIPSSLTRPSLLVIPKLNINASIEEVGMTPEGAMDVPQKPDDTAWFNLGTVPGAVGSSVIDGHSGWKNNRPAVFDGLGKLSPGDEIYVHDTNGAVITFVVRETKDYNPLQDASGVFGSNDGTSHLNLITCAGAWNDAERTHSKRLVVFADKIN